MDFPLFHHQLSICRRQAFIRCLDYRNLFCKIQANGIFHVL